MQDSGKVVLGLLAGIAIGATLGILLAPDKGGETRKRVAEGASDMQDDLEAGFDAFMDSLKQKLSAVKQEAEQAANQAKKTAETDAAQAQAGL